MLLTTLIPIISSNAVDEAPDPPPQDDNLTQFKYIDYYFNQDGTPAGGSTRLTGHLGLNADRLIIITRLNVKQSNGKWRTLVSKTEQYEKINGEWVLTEFTAVHWLVCLLFIFGLI